MSNRPAAVVLVALAASAGSAAVTSGSQPAPPPTAFPGDTARFVAVGGPCPTFLWGAVPDAERYELVLYALEGSGRLGERPSLYRSLPSSVNGWTPEGARCPEAGGRYAWAVRAIVEGQATEWSDSRLFELSALPSVEEVEQALDVLRRYAGDGRESPASLEAPEAVETPQAVP
ncbi:MAG: hypothetical protein R3190_17035, partial [Thermoanaerobaculia bacterium]|nr:hypothetical protein [Thermoanaerobaculia bacterium]